MGQYFPDGLLDEMLEEMQKEFDADLTKILVQEYFRRKLRDAQKPMDQDIAEAIHKNIRELY